MLEISLTKKALEDMNFFATNEPKTAAKIIKLMADISKNPFSGIGKAEALKHDWAGYWSRRITKEHRLIYRVEDDKVIVARCRGHYGK